MEEALKAFGFRDWGITQNQMNTNIENKSLDIFHARVGELWEASGVGEVGSGGQSCVRCEKTVLGTSVMPGACYVLWV